MSGSAPSSNSSKGEPEVAIKASGGNRIGVVLILVILLIAAALTFMLLGLGTEASERSDPSTTTSR